MNNKLGKFLFQHFGSILDMGYTIGVPDLPGMKSARPPYVLLNHDETGDAKKSLNSLIRKLPLGETLEKEGPYRIEYATTEEWAIGEIMALYTEPRVRAEVVLIRFMNKPSWLTESSVVPAA